MGPHHFPGAGEGPVPRFCGLFRPRKIVAPIAAGAAAARSLTRHARRRAPASSHDEEEAMMSIEQHVEELRAELSNCDDTRERLVIASELRLAMDALQQGLRGLGAQP
jgi:hypothetical protein